LKPSFVRKNILCHQPAVTSAIISRFRPARGAARRSMER
jgi:hypothetical protein